MKLKWTKKRPVLPGWYWWKGRYFEKSAEVIEIKRIDDPNLQLLLGEFAGPIPKPTEDK